MYGKLAVLRGGRLDWDALLQCSGPPARVAEQVPALDGEEVDATNDAGSRRACGCCPGPIDMPCSSNGCYRRAFGVGREPSRVVAPVKSGTATVLPAPPRVLGRRSVRSGATTPQVVAGNPNWSSHFSITQPGNGRASSDLAVLSASQR